MSKKKEHSEGDDSRHSSEQHELLEMMELLMATVQSVNDRLDALDKDLDRLTALFAEEAGEEGSVGVATQAELDAIDAKVAGIATKAAAIADESEVLSSPSVSAITDANHFVNLSWAAVTDAASYNVKRGDAAGAETLLSVVTSPATVYTDSTTIAGNTYFYKVSADNSASVEGKDSAEVSIIA
jgi:hypothetical protein